MRKNALTELLLFLLFLLFLSIIVKVAHETWHNVQEVKQSLSPVRVITITRGPPDSMMPPEHVAVVKDAYDNFVAIAEKSERAAELLRFFDDSAIAGTFVDWHNVFVHADPAAPTWFVVRVSPVPKTPSIGGNFACQDRVLTVVDNGTSGIAAGISLAHETSHAYDCLVGQNRMVDREDALYTELEAYLSTAEILNDWTDGAWSQIINVWTEEHQTYMAGKGLPPDLPLVDWSPEMKNDMQVVFGEVEDSELPLSTLVINAELKNAAYHCLTEVTECQIAYLDEMYEIYGNPNSYDALY